MNTSFITKSPFWAIVALFIGFSMVWLNPGHHSGWDLLTSKDNSHSTITLWAYLFSAVLVLVSTFANARPFKILLVIGTLLLSGLTICIFYTILLQHNENSLMSRSLNPMGGGFYVSAMATFYLFIHMFFMHKRLLGLRLLFLVLALAGAYGLYRFNEGNPDYAEVKADYVVTNAQLATDFKDTAKASKKYRSGTDEKPKVLEITGRVHSLEKDSKGRLSLNLDTLGMGIQCTFLDSAQNVKAGTIKKGDEVIIHGKFVDFNAGDESLMIDPIITINNASIVDKKKNSN